MRMYSNLESASTAGTVGNVCLDIKDSEVRLHVNLAHAPMSSGQES